MTPEKLADDWYEGKVRGRRYMSKLPVRKDFQKWRVADFFTDSDTLERTFAWDIWPRAESIKVQGQLLLWTPAEREERQFRAPRTDDIGALTRFLRLSNAPPEKILEFAKEWGVLNLCRHMVPLPHKSLSEEEGPCKQLQFSWGEFWEPAEMWRDYARRARAILRVASDLSRNRQGSFEDWRVLAPARTRKLDKSSFAFEMEKYALAEIVNDWLFKGHVSLQFNWGWDRPLYYINCNVLGFIACQLMFAIGRSHGLATCSSCGNLYCHLNYKPSLE